MRSSAAAAAICGEPIRSLARTTRAGGPGGDAPRIVDRAAVGVRSGFGIAVLPCIVADAEPDLVRCLPPRKDHGRVMWLLTHERVRHTPRVRAVIDFLYERLMSHVRMLEAQRSGREPRRPARRAIPASAARRSRPRPPPWPAAGCELRIGSGETSSRDQQRDFGADQRHRVAAVRRQLLDDPDIGVARFIA